MRPEDLDAVLGIERAAHRYPWSAGNFRDSLAAGCDAWVLRLAGQPAGHAVVMRAIDEAHVLDLAIAPACQRRGYGSRMLEHVLSTMRDGGVRRMLLEVRRSNEAALALYRGFGFEAIGERRGYYAAGGVREDAIVMEKAL